MGKGIIYAFDHSEMGTSRDVIIRGVLHHQSINTLIEENKKNYPFLPYYRSWLTVLHYHLERDSIHRYLAYQRTPYTDIVPFFQDFVEFLSRVQTQEFFRKNLALLDNFRDAAFSLVARGGDLIRLKEALLERYQYYYKMHFYKIFTRDAPNLHAINGHLVSDFLAPTLADADVNIDALDAFWDQQPTPLDAEMRKYCMLYMNQTLYLEQESNIARLLAIAIKNKIKLNYTNEAYFSMRNTTANGMLFDSDHAYYIDKGDNHFYTKALSHVSYLQRRFARYHTLLVVQNSGDPNPVRSPLDVGISRSALIVHDPAIHYHYVEELYYSSDYNSAMSIQVAAALRRELPMLHSYNAVAIIHYRTIEGYIRKLDWESLGRYLIGDSHFDPLSSNPRSDAEYRRFCFVGVLRRLAFKDYQLGSIRGVAGILTVLKQQNFLNLLGDDLLLNLSAYHPEVASYILVNLETVSVRMLARLLQFYPEFLEQFCQKNSKGSKTRPNYYARLTLPVLKYLILGSKGEALEKATAMILKDSVLLNRLLDADEQVLNFFMLALTKVHPQLKTELLFTQTIEEIEKFSGEQASSEQYKYNVKVFIHKVYHQWKTNGPDDALVTLALKEPVIDFLLNTIEVYDSIFVSTEAKMLQRMILGSEHQSEPSLLSEFRAGALQVTDFTALESLDPDIHCAQFFYAYIRADLATIKRFTSPSFKGEERMNQFLANQSTEQLLNFLLRMEMEQEFSVLSIGIPLPKRLIKQVIEVLSHQTKKGIEGLAYSLDWSLVRSVLLKRMLDSSYERMLSVPPLVTLYNDILVNPSSLGYIVEPLIRLVHESKEDYTLAVQRRLLLPLPETEEELSDSTLSDSSTGSPTKTFIGSATKTLMHLAIISGSPAKFFIALHTINPERAKLFYREIRKNDLVDLLPNDGETLIRLFLLAHAHTEYKELAARICGLPEKVLLLLEALIKDDERNKILDFSPRQLQAVLGLAVFPVSSGYINPVLRANITSAKQVIQQRIQDAPGRFQLLVGWSDQNTFASLAQFDNMSRNFLPLLRSDEKQAVCLFEELDKRSQAKSLLPNQAGGFLYEFYMKILPIKELRRLRHMFHGDNEMVLALFRHIVSTNKFVCMTNDELISIYALSCQGTDSFDKIKAEIRSHMLNQEGIICELIAKIDTMDLKWTSMLPALFASAHYGPLLHPRIPKLILKSNPAQLEYLLDALHKQGNLFVYLNSDEMSEKLFDAELLKSIHRKGWFIQMLVGDQFRQFRQYVVGSPIWNEPSEITSPRLTVLGRALAAETPAIREQFFNQHENLRQDLYIQNQLQADGPAVIAVPTPPPIAAVPPAQLLPALATNKDELVQEGVLRKVAM